MSEVVRVRTGVWCLALALCAIVGVHCAPTTATIDVAGAEPQIQIGRRAAASDGLRALAPLEGRWKHFVQTGGREVESGESTAVFGIGGRFLVSKGQTGTDEYVHIMRWDAKTGSYPYVTYSSSGEHTVGTWTIDADGTFRFDGIAMKPDGGEIHKDGELHVKDRDLIWTMRTANGPNVVTISGRSARMAE